MFSWIFGGQKKQNPPKPSKDNSDQIPQSQLWIYQCLTQYLQSPLWNIPLLDFIENNCIYFDEEEQNKFQYTKIFENFRQLVAGMVDSMMQQIGVSEVLLQKCIKKGLRSKHRKIFQQILVCDNFLAFKKIMIKKNKELQIEAIKQITLQDKGFAEVDTKFDELELQRLEMEKAIAFSLALKDKINEEEQKMILQAIRQSQIQEQKRLEQEIKKIQISNQPKKQYLSDLPPLIIGTTVKQQPLQQLKKQSESIELELKIHQQSKPKQVEKEKQDSQGRKKRLLEQRQLLRKQKQAARKNELAQFVEGKQQVQKDQPKVSEQQLERRRNLMKKLKEQLQ